MMWTARSVKAGWGHWMPIEELNRDLGDTQTAWREMGEARRGAFSVTFPLFPVTYPLIQMKRP